MWQTILGVLARPVAILYMLAYLLILNVMEHSLPLVHTRDLALGCRSGYAHRCTTFAQPAKQHHVLWDVAQDVLPSLSIITLLSLRLQ
jgi:hypothetical protein